jgi:hypothetical protein
MLSGIGGQKELSSHRIEAAGDIREKELMRSGRWSLIAARPKLPKRTAKRRGVQHAVALQRPRQHEAPGRGLEVKQPVQGAAEGGQTYTFALPVQRFNELSRPQAERKRPERRWRSDRLGPCRAAQSRRLSRRRCFETPPSQSATATARDGPPPAKMRPLRAA